MPDKKVTVLDILARIENLERKNATLEREIEELKASQDPETWQELICYKSNNSGDIVDFSWAENEDDKFTKYLGDGMDLFSRNVIGLIRKVN